jgi:uncharacterized protein YqjF (DUF2071 family)
MRLGFQRWDDILFVHWEVPPEALARAVDPRLEVDTFAGRAFVSLTPFTLMDARVRFLPPLPGLSRFEEVNLRTYVRHRDHSGIWFFSLDASSPLAVALARATFGLPYLAAKIRRWRAGEERHYEAERTSGRPPATLRVAWEPGGERGPHTAGTLEHFLVERYSLFSRTPAGALIRVDVTHPQWPLREARLVYLDETLSKAAQLPGPAEKRWAHASPGVGVTFTGVVMVEPPSSASRLEPARQPHRRAPWELR